MKRIAILLTFVFSQTLGNSQGCGDAGFCSVNSFKPISPDKPDKSYKNQLRLGFSGGGADYDITVFSSTLEFSRQLSSTLSMDAKLSSLMQSGNNIQSAGLSDVFVNVNYAASKKWKLILGGKIPLSDGNRKENGLALPMDYQSSLGTFDLILGVGYKLAKWQFSLGWQQPLTQNNNAFVADSYPDDLPLRLFQSTNEYIRKGDLLLRISYQTALSERISFTPGILPIYHLGDDEFTNLNGKQIINGSAGLTLNANLYFHYKASNRSGFELSLASPLVVRAVRPEGLTRSFVAGIQYLYSF